MESEEKTELGKGGFFNMLSMCLKEMDEMENG